MQARLMIVHVFAFGGMELADPFFRFPKQVFDPAHEAPARRSLIVFHGYGDVLPFETVIRRIRSVACDAPDYFTVFRETE